MTTGQIVGEMSTMESGEEEERLLDLGRCLTDEEWNTYRSVLQPAVERRLRFAIGGGLVYSRYVGRWRHTKDMDLFVLERDRDAFLDVLASEGFEDYYDTLPYDRSWIYRGCRGEFIVDCIWQMANHRAPVDLGWMKRSRPLKINRLLVRMIAPEDMLWAKL